MLGSEAAIGAEGRGGLSRGLSRGYVAGSRPHQRLILGSEDEMLTLASHNFDAAFFPSLLIVSAIASTLLAVAFAVAPLFEFTDFSTPVVLGVVTAIHLDFALLLLTIVLLSVSVQTPSPLLASLSMTLRLLLVLHAVASTLFVSLALHQMGSIRLPRAF
ncbi:unnamed protein product [Closterium sp. NIES-64]|nr:unnamed protein product [Closterium sp. NIES-64]